MPFVRQKIDPAWLDWVTRHAGAYRDAYGGNWAFDAERNAAFFFEGADPLDSTLPRHYRLKVGNDVFAVEILDSERSPVLRAGTAKIFVGPCYGAGISLEEAKELAIEAYRCLHRSPTEDFQTVSGWDPVIDFGFKAAELSAKTLNVMKDVLKDYPDVLRIVLRKKK